MAKLEGLLEGLREAITGKARSLALAGPKVRPHPAPSGVGEFGRIR